MKPRFQQRTTSSWWRVAMVVAAVAVLRSGGGDAEAARILGIFPTPSISHQMPFQAVMKALVARGHHVTILSTDPLKEPLENYTDVDLSFSYASFREKFTFANLADITGIELTTIMTTTMPELIDEQLASPQMQAFLRSNPKFDMVFFEWFWFQAYFGVVHHVGSPPLVGILSLGGITNSYNAIANPVNPAFNPEPLSGHSDKMTFSERVYNTYINLWMYYHWNWNVFPTQEKLMRKYFGDAPPCVADTERNMSLLVLHNHWSTDYARALLPNVVQITGNHVKDKPQPLPKDLQKWMDEADAGIIYLSLGSNVMSKDLPRAQREAILRVFARLPQRVMWKWEEDDLPGCPPNVRISKWFPQQAVLAHPKVRLFIMQGGLQSFQEAVFHAVPLIGIPFMGDQQYNVAKIHSSGVGRRLELRELTEESLHEAIITILQDKSYKENIQEMSVIFREHRANSMENALWWIEYVLRHNGAPHLRSAALHLTWYQYLLLDVLAAVLLAAIIFIWAVRFAIRAVCHALFGGRKNQDSTKIKFKNH